MDFAWFLPLLGFALITCGPPGPNNMLLTAAVPGCRRWWPW